jgi:hypothetical protein
MKNGWRIHVTDHETRNRRGAVARPFVMRGVTLRREAVHDDSDEQRQPAARKQVDSQNPQAGGLHSPISSVKENNRGPSLDLLK